MEAWKKKSENVEKKERPRFLVRFPQIIAGQKGE